ncbi:SDR family oxidoreductase [Opitutaceae bacterium TAV4]|uniref:SDR family oxidoreductase n=1 Tax=Geminisphaera colitermitum TaxID=1148786 RepID=UPI0001964F86|nr:SDR family oxidoreductase [Geminisphaera colitermitum]RRJ97203.1 SDR family oxidoreductase [Opitutaceae bacterium TAV4]RRK01192.1 SDR family oxidoreductase [Opitutaceae bacterium TAV3]
MNIFLTGASGLVGSAFARAGKRRGHRVLAVPGPAHARAGFGPIEGAARHFTLDLAEPGAVTTVALDLFPDAIVNCAAIAEPARCEADPVLSQRLNVELPLELARVAHHMSARFIHVSSEQVFDGTRPPYAIGSPPSPINLYGRQKLESERAVTHAAPEFAAVVRAPLLTGNSLTGTRSLHEKLFADWAAGRAPRLFADEFRQPCTAENLAEVLLELCERPAMRGVYHWAGAEVLSRHDIARRIRSHFKLNDKSAPLIAIKRADDPAASANRPADLTLLTKPLAGNLKTVVESFDAQLDQLIIPPPCREWYFQQS